MSEKIFNRDDSVEFGEDDSLEPVPGGEWREVAGYLGRPLRCKCGATALEVFRGDYYTGVRCPSCGKECDVHHG